MRHLIISISDWALRHWLALVIFLTVFWMLMLVAVAVSWLYGYWSNGLYGTKFDLDSCWKGVGAVVAGFAGITALAGVAWAKWKTDSEHNTAPGEQPNWGVKGCDQK